MGDDSREFKSNIHFGSDPIVDLFIEVEKILEAERVRIWRARQSHCCYCDPSACSPILKLRTCEACAKAQW